MKDCNFAAQYVYADDEAQLLPAGTMLHYRDDGQPVEQSIPLDLAGGWVRAASSGNGGTFVTWLELSPEEYRQRASDRRTAQRLRATQQQH